MKSNMTRRSVTQVFSSWNYRSESRLSKRSCISSRQNSLKLIMFSNNCFGKMNLRKLGRYLLIAGIVFLSFGLFMAVIVPKIIEIKISEQTRLVNNSDTFLKWKNPDIPIFIRFFFYNVTNPDEVKKGRTPIFKEIGPITYQERRIKEVDDIDTEEDTVTFRQSITYTLRPDMSSVGEDDSVTTLNMPLVGISKVGSTMSFRAIALREALHEFMYRNPGKVTVFIERKIRELLFEGYFDPLLKDLSELAGEEIFPNNTFAIYVGKNATFGAPLTIDAGVKDFRNFGRVIASNGQTKMSVWDDEYCNRLNGSDGSLFPPFVTKDRIVRLFSDDACRSVFMTFQKEVKYYNIPVYRFHLPPEVWASGESNPDNLCFCKQKKCGRSGLMNISPCKKGAPVFASLPHFLYGDEELLNHTGLSPILERDETYLDIEPTTGMLLGAKKRFQVNMDLFPNKFVRGFKKVPRMIFPILWGEEYFVSTEERLEMLTNKLFKPMKILGILQWLSFILGTILVFIASACLLLDRKQKNQVKVPDPQKIVDLKPIGSK